MRVVRQEYQDMVVFGNRVHGYPGALLSRTVSHSLALS